LQKIELPPAIKTFFKTLRTLFLAKRDRNIIITWITGTLLVLSLVYLLFQNIQTKILINNINEILTENGYNWELEEKISPWGLSGTVTNVGTWFYLRGSKNPAVLFPVIRDGVFTPFLGIVTANDVELAPLTRNAAVAQDRLFLGMQEVYLRRIKSASEKIAVALEAKKTREAQEK
jgi:hypothetical protein